MCIYFLRMKVLVASFNLSCLSAYFVHGVILVTALGNIGHTKNHSCLSLSRILHSTLGHVRINTRLVVWMPSIEELRLFCADGFTSLFFFYGLSAPLAQLCFK